MRIAIALLLVICIGVISVFGQHNVSQKIDRFATTEMQSRKIPGLAIAIVRSGKIEILKTYGFANLEHRVPVKPETIFQSGSIGKQFTAAAVMILVQEGKISLEETITKYFPEAPATWKDITVRHLLTHTAGTGDFPPDIELRRDYTEEQMFESFKKVPLAFAPGDKWNYSNVGYVILGMLVRKVTGQFYGDFLRERVFGPLGMTTTRVISEADIIPNRAAGYRVIAGEIKNQEWVSPSTNTTGDGSLYFSILDLVKWDAALYRDSPLKQSTLAQIWEPVKLNSGARKGYGFGWFTDTFHNRRVLFHGGAWQGFKSCIIRFPDDKLTIIVLANSWNAREFKLARGLAALYYPEFMVLPISSIEDTDTNVSVMVHQFLIRLLDGSIDKELVIPSVTGISAGHVKELTSLLNSLTLPVAIIHSEELVDRHDENGLRVYGYVFNDIAKTLSLTVKLNAEGKIADFGLTETNRR